MALPLRHPNPERFDSRSSDEREQLRSMARRFLTDHYDEFSVRSLMESESGHDDIIWRRLAQETGLAGLLIPEAYGGSELLTSDLQVVLEEMGSVLYSGPFMSTAVMAVVALLESGDQAAQAKLLPRIAEGKLLVALAVEEPGSESINSGDLKTTAQRSDNGFLLSGTKQPVIDGGSANYVLVFAQSDEGVCLFLVDAKDIESSVLPPMDQTRKLARLRLDKTPATLVGNPGEGARLIERVTDRVVTALAAEQLGGAQRCLEMAVEYAKSRYQFGRAIGSFQAVKHKCTDILLEIEAARSAVFYASLCADQKPDELPVAACMAKSQCSQAFRNASSVCLQVHGGIGFTWEHSCHLYLKRAKSSEVLFGDPLHYRQRLSKLLQL